MGAQPNRLPRRFPVGTKYVIEGCGGGEGRLRVLSRYIEFPDGRHMQLRVAKGRSRFSGRSCSAVKKI
jgi:hypothetical protein